MDLTTSFYDRRFASRIGQAVGNGITRAEASAMNAAEKQRQADELLHRAIAELPQSQLSADIHAYLTGWNA